MASKFETGHFKNMANFNSLISYLQALPNYAPDAQELKLTELVSVQNQAKATTDQLVTTAAALQQKVNDRQQLFDQARKLAVRLMRYLEARFADNEAALKDVRSHYTNLFSKKVNKKETIAPDGTVSEKTYSSSRLSFDSMAENFQKMVERLSTFHDYTPSEPSLQLLTLKQQYQELMNVNKTVNEQYIVVSNARIARDKMMYDKNTGMVDIAQRIKKYLQYQYGTQSEHTQYADRLKFTRKQIRINPIVQA
jgi:hypothetical protein